MIFLLDQGLPRSTVAHLAAIGQVAEHVGDIGMARATDAEILAYAVKQRAIVVTLDADFHQLLVASQATSPSVIRIRIEGLKGDKVAVLLDRVINVAASELATGAVVSVVRSRMRVRSLPIGA